MYMYIIILRQNNINPNIPRPGPDLLPRRGRHDLVRLPVQRPQLVVLAVEPPRRVRRIALVQGQIGESGQVGWSGGHFLLPSCFLFFSRLGRASVKAMLGYSIEDLRSFRT